MSRWQILHGDLFDLLPTLAADSIDACVTDPPYGLAFMGKQWDTLGEGRWHEQWAQEVFRVLKPGAYITAFGGSRTFHRLTCGLEDAGFEIRDCLSWLYGQGFPKSLNVGDGRGTALKPSWEPCVLGRKPFKGNLVGNLTKHGTGALNIDACRIGQPENKRAAGTKAYGAGKFGGGLIGDGILQQAPHDGLSRWPANVVMDEDAAVMLDEQSGDCGAGGKASGATLTGESFSSSRGRFAGVEDTPFYADSGGASRFYYVAKPSREERDYGTHGLIERQRDESRKEGNPGGDNPRNRGLQPRGNFHPTVKPIDLMRWLVKLITPPNGCVLDPFTGSGSTGMACMYEQRHFIGCEREAEYIEIARRRIRAVTPLLAQEIA